MSPSPLLQFARAHGPLPVGMTRVVVIESDSRVVVRDFGSRREAEAYAAEVNAETGGDGAPPVAAVFDRLDDP